MSERNLVLIITAWRLNVKLLIGGSKVTRLTEIYLWFRVEKTIACAFTEMTEIYDQTIVFCRQILKRKISLCKIAENFRIKWSENNI